MEPKRRKTTKTPLELLIEEEDDAPITSILTLEEPQSNDDNKYKIHAETCFGCKYRFFPQRRIGVNKAIDDLYGEYLLNRTSLDPDALVDLIFAGFEEKIWNPCMETGEEVIFWPRSKIQEHLFKHIVDPKIQVIGHIREIDNQIAELLRECQGDDRVVARKELMKCYETKLKFIDKLDNMERNSNSSSSKF